MSIASARAMVAKELHHLLPLVIAMLALEVLGLVEWFWSQSPDTMMWVDMSILLDASTAQTANGLYVLLGMIAAYMVLAHEGKQQTLQFLWSLPAYRWQIFAIKFLTALAVLTGLIVLGHLALLWVNSFSVGSITSGQFTWSLWWQEIIVLTGVTLVGLGYGALVATFRVVGILTFLATWAVVLTMGNIDSTYRYLDVLSLMDLKFRGADILLHTKAWIVHGLLATLATIVACYWWTRDDRTPTERSDRSRFVVRVGTGLSVIAAMILIFAYGTAQLAPDLLLDDDDLGEFDLQSFTTDHYQFSFYLTDTDEVLALIEEADRDAEQLMEMLDFDYQELIFADLTDVSNTDHLGIAGWQKMRVKRSALYDDELRPHVFVHETTHVLASAASDRRLSDHFAYSMFFTEGIAEWTSFEMLGLPEERHGLRLLAALAWKRHNLRFGDIMYSSAFRNEFDQGLVYALGEAWVSTLADVCGQDAPGNALKAMARPDAPRSVRGATFWQDTLQSFGCDFTTVNSRFALLLEGYADELAGVPELTSTITQLDNRPVISLSLSEAEATTPYRVTVRVRDNANASPLSVITERRQVFAGDSVTIDLPLRVISGQRFQYQIGIEFLPDRRPFFSRWMDDG